MPEDRIDPWASETYDYGRLIEKFGIEPFTLDRFPLPDPPIQFRRGVVFGCRGFEPVHRAITNGSGFAVLTGLAPSGRMHFGHKMVLDQVLAYHKWGADVFVAVADIEAWGARGVPLGESRKLAIEEYILNYIALGLPLERTRIYSQSERKDVMDISFEMSRAVNWSTMKAVYGFSGETNMSHIMSPLVQVGDILHVQLDKHGGPRPTIVPVGVDQDPHIRISRDIAKAFRYYSVQETDQGTGVFLKGDRPIEDLDAAETELRKHGKVDVNRPYRALYTDMSVEETDLRMLELEHSRGSYGFHAPSSSYNMFMTALTGGKMSSSVPDSAIFLTDTPEEAVRKLKVAVTGGRTTAEEQREQGGEPDICSVFEMLRFHLLESDEEFATVRKECLDGDRLCGACKKQAADLLETFLADLAEKREAAWDILPEYMDD